MVTDGYSDCLQVSMFEQPELIEELLAIENRLGEAIYPLRSGIGQETRQTALGLPVLFYVVGTREIRYSAIVRGVQASSPAINDERFPMKTLGQHATQFRSYIRIADLRALQSFTFDKLLDRHGQPLKVPAQAAPLRVQCPSGLLSS